MIYSFAKAWGNLLSISSKLIELEMKGCQAIVLQLFYHFQIQSICAC